MVSLFSTRPMVVDGVWLKVKTCTKQIDGRTDGRTGQWIDQVDRGKCETQQLVLRLYEM